MNSNYIDLYNSLDTRARKAASFVERTVFCPVAHNFANNPTIVSEICELPFFACTMHDGRAKSTIDDLMNGLDDEEVELFLRIITSVAELTNGFGKKTAPVASLFRHLYQRRLLFQIFPGIDNILEVGPGSGYLGLMLSLDHRTIYSFEITQAFYIYQHFLYKNNTNLIELAEDCVAGREFIHNRTFLNTSDKPKGSITHLPWWIFKDFTSDPYLLNLIVVNHAICEMHPAAVQHLIAGAVEKGFPPFFMEGEGAKYLRSFDQVKKQFEWFGYGLAKRPFPGREIFIFEKSKHRIRLDPQISTFWILRLIKKISLIIPFYVPIQNEMRRLLGEIFSIAKVTIPSVYFRYFQRNTRYKSRKDLKRTYFRDLMPIYSETLGTDRFLTPNDEFLSRIKSSR